MTNNKNKSNLILYGRHAVISALQNPKRQIEKLLCTKENAQELQKFSKKIQIVERKEIDKLLSHDSVHQGIALICKPLPNTAIEDIIAETNNKENCNILIFNTL